MGLPLGLSRGVIGQLGRDGLPQILTKEVAQPFAIGVGGQQRIALSAYSWRFHMFSRIGGVPPAEVIQVSNRIANTSALLLL